MNFKDLFSCSDEEWLLVDMDFSQLEVCGLAEMTNDSVLIKEVNTGVDIHTANAAMWLGKPTSAVTKEERQRAKVMTFQLQYGAGAKKIAQTLDIAESAAISFIEKFYEKYKAVKTFHKQLSNFKIQNEDNDHITLFDLCGRKYTVGKKTDKATGTTYFSLPELKNYPIQGFSTGGIVPVMCNLISENLSMLKVLRCCRIINTVHDNIMFEVNCEKVLELFRCIEFSFTMFPERFKQLFDYELKVVYNYDIKVGTAWSDMDKYTRAEIQTILEGVRANA